MDREKLLIESKQKIDEIDEKLTELRTRFQKLVRDKSESSLNSIYEHLKTIRNKIHIQYLEIKKSDKLKNGRLTEMEKNIFNSITSFEDAFTKAGKIFKTK